MILTARCIHRRCMELRQTVVRAEEGAIILKSAKQTTLSPTGLQILLPEPPSVPPPFP